MIFFRSERPIRRRSQTVVRLLEGEHIKPGMIVPACVEICQIRVLKVSQEPLDSITQEDVAKEGFPERTPIGYIDRFCRVMECGPTQIVSRIEFEYVG